MPGTNLRAMEKAPDARRRRGLPRPRGRRRARRQGAGARERDRGARLPRLVGVRGQRAHQRPRHPLVLPRRRRGRRGARRRARHACSCPKVGSPTDVEFVATLLDQIEQAQGLGAGRIGIHILIETALGHGQRRGDRARGPDRLEAMVFGVADYAASVQARTTNIGGANPDYSMLTDRGRRRRPGDPLGRPVALRHLAHGRGVPGLGAAPDRRPVRGLRRRRRLRGAAAPRGRPGVRGQVGDPPSQIELANEVFTPGRGRGRPGPAHPARRWRRPRRKARGGLARRPPDRRGLDPHGAEPDAQGRAVRTRSASEEPVEREHPRVPGEVAARQYRVTTPRGGVVYTSKAAARVAEELGGQRWVVKAQIHAGGRGKAGGVKIGTSPSEWRRSPTRCSARRWSPRRPAPRASASAACSSSARARIEREFYLGLGVDRDSQRIVVIASAEGRRRHRGRRRADARRIHAERRPRRRAARLPVPQGGDRDRTWGRS